MSADIHCRTSAATIKDLVIYIQSGQRRKVGDGLYFDFKEWFNGWYGQVFRIK